MEILRGADTDKSGTINYTGKFLQWRNFFLRIFGRNNGLANLPKRIVLEGCLLDV
jgi:hypothetical protein